MSPAKDPTKHLPIHELYADQLLSLKLGYALYEPDPGEGQDEVRVGDVGYVFHGRFKRLYNVFSSELEYPAVEPRFRKVEAFADLDEGVMSSECVRSGGAQFGAGGSEPLFGASASACVKISCNSDCGASLFTKYRANVERSPFPDALKVHFLKYVYTWLADAQRQGKPVKHLNDLILVTGRVMTGDWATIAFSGRTQEHGVSFNIKAITVTASGTVWGRWSEHVNLPKRHGPTRPAPIAEGEEPAFDQCIFIETFRVFDRPWYARLKAAISLRGKDGPPMMQSPKGNDTNPASPTNRSTSDSKLIHDILRDDELADMPEVVSAYHALAFRAFEESDFDADLICIDEEDIKRTASNFGTYSVAVEDLEVYDEVVVERLDDAKEPQGLKVGKIGRSMESLMHLFATGGAFGVMDGSDVDWDEYEDMMEKLSELGFSPPMMHHRTSGEDTPVSPNGTAPASSATSSVVPKAEDFPYLPDALDGGSLGYKDWGQLLEDSDTAKVIVEGNASKLESKSPSDNSSSLDIERSLKQAVTGSDPVASDTGEVPMLHAPAPIQRTPSETRRQFLPSELSEALRRNLIWEKHTIDAQKLNK